MNNPHTTDPMRDHIMNVIKTGGARMRPRWRFVFASVSFAGASLLAFLALLFAASLSVFLLRESGAWFAPSFGVRGWFAFVRSIPLWHIIIIMLFMFVLEAMIRRYALVYRRPLAGSFVGVAAIILVGGIAIGQTSLHAQIASFAHNRQLPAPLNLPYRELARVAPAFGIYKGTVVAKEGGALVIERRDADADDKVANAHPSAVNQESPTAPPRVEKKENNQKNDQRVVEKQGKETNEHKNPVDYPRRGKKQTRIVVTPHTRLPHKHDFEIGSRVVVQGHTVATDTIEAFGVRDVED